MLWKRIDTKNGGSEKMKEGRGDGREKSEIALEWSRKARTAAQRSRIVSIRSGTRSNVSEKAGAIWRRPHQVKMQTSISSVSLPALEVKEDNGVIPFFISIKCLNL